MKTEDFILFGAGIIAVFIFLRSRGASAVASSGAGSSYPTRINAGQWQYYTDGTAISPEGDYYYQSKLIYRAAT